MKILTAFFCLMGMTTFLIGYEVRAEKFRFEDLPRLVREKTENVAASRQHLNTQIQLTGRLARLFLPKISAQVGQEEFKTGTDPAEQKAYWRIDGTVNLYRGDRDRIEDRQEAAARTAEADATRPRAAHKLREVVANDPDFRHDLKVLSELITASEDDVKQAETFLLLTERDYFEAKSDLESLIAERAD